MPSEVLLALGLSPEWALGSLRLTAGRATTPEHVARLVALLPDLVARVRRLSEVRPA
jgi:cysteine desulfurase